MKFALSRPVVNQACFALFFNLLFFMPYLGESKFRVDQLLCFAAISWVLFQAMMTPIEIPRDLAILFRWACLILFWAFVVAFVTPGDFMAGLQLTNSFSYPAGGIALFILARRQIQKDLRTFLLVSLLVSIFVNWIAVYMWNVEDNDVVAWIAQHYGGGTDASYGDYGTLGAVSIYNRRMPSLFPHTQAFGVYDLMILAVSVYVMYLAKSWMGRLICVTAALLSFVGGALSSSKTYMYCIFIAMGTYLLISLPNFIRKPKLNLYYVTLLILPFVVGAYYYNENRFMRDQLDAVLALDWRGIFSSRVGDEGYLVKSGTIAAMMQPAPFLLGMGREVGKYAWTDNGYFQVLMYGGFLFFICFYAFITYLVYLFYLSREEISSIAFLVLFLSFYIGNTGTFMLLFPRAGLLLYFFTMVALYHAELRSPPSMPEPR